ncbi:MAG: hypothetical protein SFU83_21715 [Meiothermus sp.]|nr:hypothetical protein [Meiothermus sp.]
MPTARVNKVSPGPNDDFIIGFTFKAKAILLGTESSKDGYRSILPKSMPIEVLSGKEALKRLTSKLAKN